MQTLTTGLASLSARRTSSGTTPRNVVRCRAAELRARRSAWSGRGVHVRVVRDQSCVARPGHLLTKVADGSVRCEVGVRPTLSRRRLDGSRQSSVVSQPVGGRPVGSGRWPSAAGWTTVNLCGNQPGRGEQGMSRGRGYDRQSAVGGISVEIVKYMFTSEKQHSNK